MGFRFNTRRSLGAGLIPGGGGAILKPQDVFATSLYTFNGGASVTNGIDLAGRGGLVWEKTRAAGVHQLADTVRGSAKVLYSHLTNAEAAAPAGYPTFGPSGYDIPAGSWGVGAAISSWSFARAAKFFDIVTWTGDGTSNRLIPHGLGVVPGMQAGKCRSIAGSWFVTHRGLSTSQTGILYLNRTDAESAPNASVFPAAATSSNISVGLALNASGETYVAYIFAHDPSADGIVQCGVSTANSSGLFTIPHGWTNGAQWLLYKLSSTAGDNWWIYDTARTPGFSGSDAALFANSPSAEISVPSVTQSSGVLNVDSGNGNGTHIWAIIRAPY